METLSLVNYFPHFARLRYNISLLRRGYYDQKVSGVGIQPVIRYPKGQEKENNFLVGTKLIK